MKIITVVFRLSVTLFFLSTSLVAQENKSLAEKFTNYYQGFFPEKLFVHTDRTSYFATEKIWFKLYNTDGILNKPISLSKVAYLEILDAQNKAISQAKIALQDGFGSGNMYLPNAIKSGTYRFRAYTAWMKNFGAHGYFEKTITIVNPREAAIESPKNSEEPDIQFLPEGGHLVAGFSSKVACKVVGADGKGLSYKAFIYSQKDTIQTFQSENFGIGTFQLIPEINTTYQCLFRIGSKEIIKALPKVEMKGYVLHTIKQDDEKIEIEISSNIQADESLCLIAHNSRVIHDVQHIVLKAGHVSLMLDKQKLSEGITTVTVFNSKGQPVCGRLYFKKPGKQLNISVSGNQKTYRTRTLVDMEFMSTDQFKSLLSANLSLAVYKADALQGKEQQHIQSYLWLSSALKGEIEQPDYYFSDENTGEALDRLLLTQGWMKYEWENILNGEKPVLKFLPEYEGQLITGQLSDIEGRPIAKAGLYFSVPGEKAKVFGTETDAAGSFLFNIRNFYGTKEIVIQANSIYNDTSARISLGNAFSEQYTTSRLPVFKPSRYERRELELNSLSAEVQKVYFSGSVSEYIDFDSDTAAFYGKPFKTYIMDDYVRFNSMKEVFTEFVSTVYTIRAAGQTQLRMMKGNVYLDANPLMLINGVPVFNVKKLMEIDPHEMKSMELVNRRYLFGNRLEDGILNISTNKKDMAGYEIEPNALILDYQGLQRKAVFYSPQYNNNIDLKLNLPDFRKLLAWEPALITNQNGKAKYSFYTSDLPGSYIGVVQGIAMDGNSGYAVFNFNVENK